MSAVFGLWDQRGGEFPFRVLERMAGDLKHRSLDGSGMWSAGPIVIGHGLTIVSPQAKSEQSPFVFDDLVISADVRLDERQSLMKAINLDHHEHLAITDPELIAHAYRKWGLAFVKHLTGDFAFALWDRKQEQLILARDQVGAKMLLYSHQNGRIVFSSELRALIGSGVVHTAIDKELLLNQVIGIFDQPTRTIWKDIHKVSPATLLVIDRTSQRKIRYWDQDRISDVRYHQSEEYAFHLRGLMKQAVADRLPSVFPIGVPLSGGLDSSTIAVIAAPLLRDKGDVLHTVSSVLGPGYKGEAKDELHFIQSVLQQEENIIPKFVHQTELNAFEGLPLLQQKTCSLVSQWHYVDEAIYQSFAAQGVRRILSGALGDMTVSNKTIFPMAMALRSGRWLDVLRSIPGYTREYRSSGLLNLIKEEILRPGLSPRIRDSINKVRGRSSQWMIDPGLFILSTKERRSLESRANDWAHQQQNGIKTVGEAIWPKGMDANEEAWESQAAHHGIEITMPWLDRRIIEYLVAIPPEAFRPDGERRGLIRRAMSDSLPPSILNRRSKGHFSPGFHELLANNLIKGLKSRRIGSEDPLAEFGINTIELHNRLNHLSITQDYTTLGPQYWVYVKLVQILTLEEASKSVFKNWNLHE